MNQSNEVWEQLHEARLVVGDEPETEGVESPWYVQILLAFSGWLTSICVFAFLGMAFNSLLDSAVNCSVVGGIMIVGAFYVLKLPKSEFYEHLGLAIGLVGQVLIVISIFKITDKNQAAAWALSAVLQVGLSIIIPNFIHRVFSAFFAAFFFSIALSVIGVSYLFSGVVMFVGAWVWLNEFKYPQHHKMLSAIGYGLVLALIQIKGSALFLQGAMTWSSDYTSTDSWIRPWVGEVLCCIVLLFVVWQLLNRYKVPTNSLVSIVTLASALIIGIVSLEANGITAGLMILLLGFSSSNRTLMGLGVVSLLFYISSYYYLIDVTLLEKAMTLFVFGVVLLLIRWVLIRKVFTSKGLSNA